MPTVTSLSSPRFLHYVTASSYIVLLFFGGSITMGAIHTLMWIAYAKFSIIIYSLYG